MDSERVTAIKVQVEQGYYVESDEGFLFEDEQASKDVEYLLTELGKLQAVADAAREIVALSYSPVLARNWATDRLTTARAALTGEGE